MFFPSCFALGACGGHVYDVACADKEFGSPLFAEVPQHYPDQDADPHAAVMEHQDPRQPQRG